MIKKERIIRTHNTLLPVAENKLYIMSFELHFQSKVQRKRSEA